MSPRGASQQWDLHMQWARAAATHERAKSLHETATARSDELLRAWAAARIRRNQLGTQRAVLRTQMNQRRGPATLQRAPLELLERARILAGLSLRELWIGYVALGGNASLEKLAAILDSQRPMTALDHDVLVMALNDRFADDGFGHPLDYWDEE